MYKVVIKVQLLISEDMIKEARRLISGGTIRSIAIFETETGVVIKLVNNEQEAGLFIRNNTPKDEMPYSSVIVNLCDCLEGRIQI